MKNIFITIILVCTINSIFAQYPVLSTTSLANDPRTDINFSKSGNYARDFTNQRDQYVGLWRYSQNGILFEVKIEKKDKYINKIEYQGQVSYNFMDRVVLKYKLIKNGILLYDNLNVILPEDYLSLASKYGVSDYLSGLMVDETHKVRASVSIKLLNTNPQKIHFDLASGAYHYLNPDSYYENLTTIFTIPLNGIEMVRVN